MEARWLKCDNVDLTHGIVTLERTKGGDKRIIVLHDSMLELMRKYDQVISKEIPSRTSFFPNKMAVNYTKTGSVTISGSFGTNTIATIKLLHIHYVITMPLRTLTHGHIMDV